MTERNSYRAVTEKGDALTFSGRNGIGTAHGYYGKLYLGEKMLCRGPMMKTQRAAQDWAQNEVKRYREYRQTNGEGFEEVQERARKAKHEAYLRMQRMHKKSAEMYDLLQALVSDLELLSDLPAQTAIRVAKVRAIMALIDTPKPDDHKDIRY